MTASQQCLIVGAGHAGSQMAASLRTEGYGGRIKLISNEACLPYHRPPLSKTFLKSSEDSFSALRSEAFYATNAIDLLLDREAGEIDCLNRKVKLSDGSWLSYDALVLATGARPRLPEIRGASHKGVETLRNFEDAKRIKTMVAHARSIVIIGAGFIGMELAHTLLGLERNVTIIESAERILARSLSPMLSAHIYERSLRAGIRIRLGTQVAEITERGGSVAGVRTADGELIAADLAIIGVGALPNVELAASSGIKIDNGIVVDQHMRTSAPDVYAIGDCASYHHWQAGCNVRLESVQNATDQARCAAKALVGLPVTFNEVPWFWSDQGDMKIQIAGYAKDVDDVVLATSGSSEESFTAYLFSGPRLVAVESLNEAASHIVARRLLVKNLNPSKADVRMGLQHLKAMVAGAAS